MLKTKSAEEVAYRPETRASDVPTTETVTDTLEERRVRPEELAEAIRSLENRKRTLYPGTLPFDTVAKSLPAGLSSAELWQEVESLRKQPRQKTKKTDRVKQLGLGLMAIIAAGCAAWAFLGQAGYLATPATSPVVQTVTLTETLPVFIPEPTTKRLGDLKEGEAFSLDYSGFVGMYGALKGNLNQNRKPLRQEQRDAILIDTAPRRHAFEAVLLEGKTYIRAYVSEDPNFLKKQVWFANHPTSNFVTGGKEKLTRQIQIPLEALSEPYDDGYRKAGETILIASWLTKLDKHAWEPWKPR